MPIDMKHGKKETVMSKMSSDTLWDFAASEVQARERAKQEDAEEDDSLFCERTMLFLGSKTGGKTTILFRCIERDEAPKPTMALEYTFGRRAKAQNTPKDIVHLWELGGGTSLSELIQIPITPHSIRTLSVVLVLDLSKPNSLWVTMEKLLHSAQMQVEQVFASSKKSGESRSSHQQRQRRVLHILHKDHPDRELISPFPLPLLLIGSKFDIFQDFESEKKKVICKTMRFLAHYYGASLIFTSYKSETMMLKTKNLFNHLAFGTERGKSFSTDLSKPLVIPAGMDSLSQIGSPPASEVEIGLLHAKNPLDLWKKLFERIFPQEKTAEQKELRDPAKDPQYTEAIIDAMRAQKDQELEQYKREQAKSWKGLALGS